MLNLIWAAFFLIAVVAGFLRFLDGDTAIFQQLVQATFDSAKLSVDIALGLIGVLALWSGLFRIAEKSGLIQKVGQWLSPVFERLMPEVPKGHPAQGAVTMNLAANMLGLDNAATPLGLKAMQELQSLNPSHDTASNAQILFLVLNTASVTLLPITIFMYRAQLGATDPTVVFLPILLASIPSTLVGLIVVMMIQKIRLDAVLLAFFSGFLLVVGSVVYWLTALPSAELSQHSQVLANGVLLTVIAGFIGIGLYRRVAVYEEFVVGAKEGFETAVRLIPYLVAMLVAIAVFRASGALDFVGRAMSRVCEAVGLDTAFVDALPVALMKPFSGSGARAMMLDVMNNHGVDSFVGKVAAVMQGSTETTFYVLTVYFGVVGITRIRYALWCGLLCDVAGLAMAVLVSYWFFG